MWRWSGPTGTSSVTHARFASSMWASTTSPAWWGATPHSTVTDQVRLSSVRVEEPVPEAALCIRSGYLALRNIADFFSIPYDPSPKPDDAISIIRHEFDKVCHWLESEGVPMKPDRDQAWRDFVGWRVNYDTVLSDWRAVSGVPLGTLMSRIGRARAALREMEEGAPIRARSHLRIVGDES